MRVLLVCLLVAAVRGSGGTFAWTWRCESGLCIRHSNKEVTNGMQLNACKLTCGNMSVVWPLPTGPATFGNKTTSFVIDNIQFQFVAPDAVKPMLQNASEIFLENLRMLSSIKGQSGERKQGCTASGDCSKSVDDQKVKVVVTVDTDETTLALETSESSQLLINHTTNGDINVLVNASTFFGARHGLETVSQLINYDDENACLQILDSAVLSDEPVYPIRAITLDTSRNFVSLAGLRRTIDAMAMNKLNTLHWHITDTHSFPIEIPSEPRMAQYGAYSPDKVYTAQEVADLVQYARQRGVRLVPELDAPAHVGYGWQWGEEANLSKLAVCVGKEPWESYCVEPPCGQMNIINDNMYTVLGKIYQHYEDVFKPDIFHMGGDEINLNCWKTTPEIADYVKNQGGDPTDDHEYMKLWAQYQTRAADLWRYVSNGRHTPLLLWTSDFTKEEISRASVLSPSDYIIQIWTTGTDQHIGDLLQQGFPVLMSNYDAWYFDCGFSAWVGKGHNWCAPYKSWQTVYENSPRAIVNSFASSSGANYAALVRGGSAALWSEQSDDSTLDTKLWPRGAALAERLWAEPETDSMYALTRLVHHRERMVQRGIGAESLQPEYCHQNDGVCVSRPAPSRGAGRPVLVGAGGRHVAFSLSFALLLLTRWLH